MYTPEENEAASLDRVNTVYAEYCRDGYLRYIRDWEGNVLHRGFESLLREFVRVFDAMGFCEDDGVVISVSNMDGRPWMGVLNTVADKPHWLTDDSALCYEFSPRFSKHYAAWICVERLKAYFGEVPNVLFIKRQPKP